MGTICDGTRYTTRGVHAGVGLVAVGMIAAPQTLPNVTDGERFALSELLNVTEFMEQKLRVESRRRCQKYGSAKCDGSYRRPAQQPASHSERQAASTVTKLTELGPLRDKIVRKLERTSHNSARYFRDISHLSPEAVAVIRDPSV